MSINIGSDPYLQPPTLQSSATHPEKPPSTTKAHGKAPLGDDSLVSRTARLTFLKTFPAASAT